MKTIFFTTFFAINIFIVLPSKAWGPEGHKIVAQVAMNYLSPEAKKNVLAVLGGMPLDTAANWMDIMRSNYDYNFMKPWHYVDFAKEQTYKPNSDENIVNRIQITYNELQHKQTLCSDQIKMDVLILFHLLGDLGMPLHTGYDDDLGGNKRALQFDTLKTNLHKFWDEDIIRLNSITLQSCLDMYADSKGKSIDSVKGIHPVLWMKDSRSLLNTIYDFHGFIVNAEYVKNAKPIVIRQLLVSGLRLAEMLNKLFSVAPILDMEQVAKKYKNGIDAKNAAEFNGKNVTACGRVYEIKATDNVTFINLSAPYPNSPLTVVIFKKDQANFPFKIEEYYLNKNLCVKGEVKIFKGKAEVEVSSPSNILIQ